MPNAPSAPEPTVPTIARMEYTEDEDLIPTKVGARASETLRASMQSIEDEPMPSTQPARPAKKVERAIVSEAPVPSLPSSEAAHPKDVQSARALEPHPASADPFARKPSASFVERMLDRELSLRTRVAIIAGSAALSSLVTVALTR